MWKKIQDSPNYYIKFIDEKDYEIFITDYISIWSIKFTRKEFLKGLEDSNEGLEYSDEDEFLRKGINMLSDPDKLKKKSLEKKENGKILEMSLSRFLSYNLKFKCELSKGSEQIFYENITNPLLKKINDLHSSQNELLDLLKRKDEEIFAYKSKGKELSLRSIKTNEFDEESHKNRYNMSDTNFELYEPQTTTEYPVDKEINVKEETDCSSHIKTEEKPSVKIAQQPDNEIPSNEYINGTTNLISMENIKQEIVEHSEIACDMQVKRRRKKPNF